MHNKSFIEITILYKIDFQEKDKGIKIFGKEFVNNNRKNCKIKYKNKEMKITDIFKFDKEINSNNNIEDGILEIKLKGINNVKDMRFFL